ncbi:MAG: MBL fold metallo-hydrolase [Melioribacteraceae bacterium]
MNQNRRKFLKKGIIATLGSFVIPKMLLADEDKNQSFILRPDPNSWQDDDINIAWIGHATILINFYGTIILTDPVLLKRVGQRVLGLTFGPSRIVPPALAIDDIPKPDIILLSHAHFDHTDYSTLEKLTNKFPNEIDVVVAMLTKDVIDDLKWKSITIMDWKDVKEVSGIKLTAIETKHFGWRFPWEKDRSRGFMKDGRSYNAYLLEKNGKGILFGGDTAMTDKYEIVKDENVDVAIMPIGAYNPWTDVHCNPEEALTMASNIGARFFIPIHCKTFKLGAEPYDEPIEWLNKSEKNYKLSLGLDTIGGTFTLKNS